MLAYLLFVCLILATTLLDGPLPAGGFVWDFLNALGFCGLAALVYLGWDSDSPAKQPTLRLHSNLAIVAAVVSAAHALGFVLWDPTVVEYLKLKAPWYMHAGLVSLLSIVLLAVTSFPAPRKIVYGRFPRFRGWHLALSVAALGTAAWHVLGTGFYLAKWFQQLVFCLVVVALPVFAYLRRRSSQPLPTLARITAVAEADRQSMFGALFAIGLAGLYAGLKNV